MTVGTGVRRWSPRQRLDSSSTASPTGAASKIWEPIDSEHLTHEEHIFQLSVEGLPTEFPPLRTLTSSKGNLPIRDLTLVGRQLEKDSVIEALEESRLVTSHRPRRCRQDHAGVEGGRRAHLHLRGRCGLSRSRGVADDNLLAAAVARQLHITESLLQSITDTLISRLAKAHC